MSDENVLEKKGAWEHDDDAFALCVFGEAMTTIKNSNFRYEQILK